MRKIITTFPLRIRKLSLYLFLIILAGYLLNACSKKEDNQENRKLKTAAISQISREQVKTTSNVIYGACPYPCGDARCVNYSDPSLDCPPPIGPNRICGSDFAYMKLNNTTFSAAVDSVGKWHNDSQKNLLNRMKAKNITLQTDTLQSFLKNTSRTYLATKGITPQNTSVPNFDLSDTVWQIASFSTQAQSILTQLKSLVNNYIVTQHTFL